MEGSFRLTGDLTNIPTNAASTQLPPPDLSILGMFEAADWVVQSVMIGLLAASILVWTIFIAKMWSLGLTRTKRQQFGDQLGSAKDLVAATRLWKDCYPEADGRWLKLLLDEMDAPSRLGSEQAILDRIRLILSAHDAIQIRHMKKGTSILASVGSTAPFVGLFGTVWGIMNAFVGIAKSQTTNLAVVAPGIAEALLATALGLMAAIPAVVLYNILTRTINEDIAANSTLMSHWIRLTSRILWQSTPEKNLDRQRSEAAKSCP